MEVEVSTRHLSFIETGRAKPSREMVLLLSSALDIPLRDRNALLHAAGYAPAYRETDLMSSEMEQMRQALVLILRQHEPFLAVAFDRSWDLVMFNEAYARLASLLGMEDRLRAQPLTVTRPPRLNLLHLLFAPDGLRPFIANWEQVSQAVLARVRREAAVDRDPTTQELLKSLQAYPGVVSRHRETAPQNPLELVLPVELRLGDQTLRFFSTLTSLGTPLDVTLQELRIESFHAADAPTERLIRDFARVQERHV
jgi:hypothetical protein